MTEEMQTRIYIEDMDRSCSFLLDAVNLGNKIDIVGHQIGVDFEVRLNHYINPYTTYYFGSYEEAQQKAKELYPDADWETTGW